MVTQTGKKTATNNNNGPTWGERDTAQKTTTEHRNVHHPPTKKRGGVGRPKGGGGRVHTNKKKKARGLTKRGAGGKCKAKKGRVVEKKEGVLFTPQGKRTAAPPTWEDAKKTHPPRKKKKKSKTPNRVNQKGGPTSSCNNGMQHGAKRTRGGNGNTVWGCVEQKKKPKGPKKQAGRHVTLKEKRPHLCVEKEGWGGCGANCGVGGVG